MKVCGVDPGKSGGLVIIENGDVIFKTVMPVIKSSKGKPEYDIRQIVDAFVAWKPDMTYLEKALLHPKSGKSAHASTAFCNGLFQGIMSALNLPYDIISPREWQKEIFKGMSQKDTKQASILFARRTAPTVDWRATVRSTNYSDGLTDAYAIAVFGSRQKGEKHDTTQRPKR